jgi:hypothetical protein
VALFAGAGLTPRRWPDPTSHVYLVPTFLLSSTHGSVVQALATDLVPVDPGP